uniref:Uncharacterized protein n=1 Tax=Megaselia scalaris TaxID=36166 RepID=T1GCX0_MEGSC
MFLCPPSHGHGSRGWSCGIRTATTNPPIAVTPIQQFPDAPQENIHASIPQQTTEKSSTKQQQTIDLLNAVKAQLTAFSIIDRKVRRIVSNFDNINGPAIELKIEDLHFQWNRIAENHEKILTMMSGSEINVNYCIDTFCQIEDSVEDCIGNLMQKKRFQERNHLDPFTSSDRENAIGMVHLPKVNLPKFDGNHMKWHSFKTLFTDMIDAAKISDSQKLFYLKSSLIGSAAPMAEVMDDNMDNYKNAFKRLKDKYDNDRILTTVLAEKFFNQPNVKINCSQSLTEFVNDRKNVFAVLRRLKLMFLVVSH